MGDDMSGYNGFVIKANGETRSVSRSEFCAYLGIANSDEAIAAHLKANETITAPTDQPSATDLLLQEQTRLIIDLERAKWLSALKAHCVGFVPTNPNAPISEIVIELERYLAEMYY